MNNVGINPVLDYIDNVASLEELSLLEQRIRVRKIQLEGVDRNRPVVPLHTRTSRLAKISSLVQTIKHK